MNGADVNDTQDSKGIHIQIPELIKQEKRIDTIVKLNF